MKLKEFLMYPLLRLMAFMIKTDLARAQLEQDLFNARMREYERTKK